MRTTCEIEANPSKKRKMPTNTESMDTMEANETKGKGDVIKKLREFGYAFNDAGELRKIDKATGELTDEQFQFEISDDRAKNQEHYEQIGEIIQEFVYHLLEEIGLSRIYIPPETPPEMSTFIFTYPKSLCKPKKLLVLIHGSGVVRAGQWARSLIINNSLKHGTQIPYIERARQLGYDVIVTNTNDNYRIINGERKQIKGLSCPTKHSSYVWKNYVMACEPDSVAVVAHSYGGGITTQLATDFPDFFQNHVFAIAFTDSAHCFVPEKVVNVIGHKTRNWVSSEKPLDTEIRTPAGDFKRVSAGDSRHEFTSYSAMDSVMAYLEEKYNNKIEKQKHKN